MWMDWHRKVRAQLIREQIAADMARLATARTIAQRVSNAVCETCWLRHQTITSWPCAGPRHVPLYPMPGWRP